MATKVKRKFATAFPAPDVKDQKTEQAKDVEKAKASSKRGQKWPKGKCFKEAFPKVFAEIDTRFHNLDELESISTPSKQILHFLCNAVPACLTCGQEHTYEKSILARTIRGSGCVWCAQHGDVKRCKCNSLASRPDLVEQIVDETIDPMKISLNSHRLLSWKCTDHTTCEGHVWTARVSSLVAGKGCPCCLHRPGKICSCELLTKHPISSELDVKTNLDDRIDTNILAWNSSVFVNWICAQKHKFSTTPFLRTRMHAGCPTCSKFRKRSGFATKMVQALDELKLEWSDEVGFPDCRDLSELRFDFLIAKHCLLAEVDGHQHIERSALFDKEESTWISRRLHDRIKNVYAPKQNYHLLRVTDRLKTIPKLKQIVSRVIDLILALQSDVVISVFVGVGYSEPNYIEQFAPLTTIRIDNFVFDGLVFQVRSYTKSKPKQPGAQTVKQRALMLSMSDAIDTNERSVTITPQSIKQPYKNPFLDDDDE